MDYLGIVALRWRQCSHNVLLENVIVCQNYHCLCHRRRYQIPKRFEKQESVSVPSAELG